MKKLKKLLFLESSLEGLCLNNNLLCPFPGGDIDTELYAIWYEHAQKAAVECFEFLNANFPKEQKELNKSIDKLFD